MVSNISIRPANKTDVDVLTSIAFEAKAHWGYSAEFMESCRDELCQTVSMLEAEHAVYRVLESGGEVLGFYALVHLSGHKGELDALFVRPAFIGKGVGKALMEHATEYAKGRGYKSLRIHADPNAVKFYEAGGAVVIGQKESGSIKGRYLPVLELKI